jgi:hypothetical protein
MMYQSHGSVPLATVGNCTVEGHSTRDSAKTEAMTLAAIMTPRLSREVTTTPRMLAKTTAGMKTAQNGCT